METKSNKDEIWYCPMCNNVWRDTPLPPKPVLAVKQCPKCGNNKYSSLMPKVITDSVSPYCARLRNEFLNAEKKKE